MVRVRPGARNPAGEAEELKREAGPAGETPKPPRQCRGFHPPGEHRIPSKRASRASLWAFPGTSSPIASMIFFTISGDRGTVEGAAIQPKSFRCDTTFRAAISAQCPSRKWFPYLRCSSIILFERTAHWLSLNSTCAVTDDLPASHAVLSRETSTADSRLYMVNT